METETVRLEKFVPGGQAIGTLDSGQKAFVWGGLPGELVSFVITKRKKSYLEGLVPGAGSVLDPSAERLNPRDACYLSTSPWQTMNYDYELAQKALLIEESLAQEGIKLDAPVPSPVTDGKDFEYRNKMEYSLWWDNDSGKISLAFHRRGSHGKVPVEQSSIERPEIFAEAQSVVADLNARGEEARKYQSLVVRCNQAGEVVSALFENGKPHPKMPELRDKLLGHEFSYSPNGFFQINLPVYELALTEIQKHITTDKVVDMYAGVGTIGLTVARDRDLTLVETDKSAYRELERNCAGTKAKPVLAKSEEALEHITSDATIIVDPPRAGLHTAVVERLLETTPPVIIYLSCNPTTQARDVKPLLDKYEIELVKPYNFFPRTPHIENLIVLKRR